MIHYAYSVVLAVEKAGSDRIANPVYEVIVPAAPDDNPEGAIESLMQEYMRRYNTIVHSVEDVRLVEYGPKDALQSADRVVAK